MKAFFLIVGFLLTATAFADKLPDKLVPIGNKASDIKGNPISPASTVGDLIVAALVAVEPGDSELLPRVLTSKSARWKLAKKISAGVSPMLLSQDEIEVIHTAIQTAPVSVAGPVSEALGE